MLEVKETSHHVIRGTNSQQDFLFNPQIGSKSEPSPIIERPLDLMTSEAGMASQIGNLTMIHKYVHLLLLLSPLARSLCPTRRAFAS